ncbi:MAG: hypothetical protein COU35_02250 [Candidatus Magasanikbacteria bacterium CG10_big_fil_rev_8_21_14_0_10_47_10]|uniref:Uncharacterized protein n=1 Tax=Candidatus Magasanikbacteria bacterium CG10_big_fil_rev_8_21_14_0_10_47_10 TaxID=1974652 RepID=A0A2H0TQN5_9BACT|nr:MAG: hypothetical protein COU35_02250 [Candidatus Magasanikbacteria bacterium CG10_big_fil_rev_8_21_14_0_10_47_10]
MYQFVPFILIVISLGVIIVILVRKFPSLTLLDVENMPEVKIGRKKQAYLRKKLTSKNEQRAQKRSEKVSKGATAFRAIQHVFRTYVGDVEVRLTKKDHERKETAPPEVKSERKKEAKQLLADAAEFMRQQEIEQAEQVYINVIRLEPKNPEAYGGLVDIYIKKEQWDEAKQTCGYLLQLDPHNDVTHAKMAQIAEEEGDRIKAIEHYQQAVLINHNLPQRFVKLADLLEAEGEYQTALEAVLQALDLEQDNPKYLDKSVELAILVGDKKMSEELYDRFRMVNPDNQKLDVLKEKVRKLEE